MTGIEIAVAGLALASTAISVVGAISQGQASMDAYSAQATADYRNAALADQDRIQAVQTAQLAAEDSRREHRRQLAQLRAAYGSTGIEFAGSPLEVLQDTATEMALDERRIEYEGQMTGRSYALKALGLRESAGLASNAGVNAQGAGLLNAVGTGASGLANIGAYGAGRGWMSSKPT